jgi:uncharacterized protein
MNHVVRSDHPASTTPPLLTSIKEHPVLSYYGLVFTISWGGMLLVGGPGLFSGRDWQTDPLFPLAVLALLAGPPVAGLVMTGLVSGLTGYRELLSRLLRWRVGGRWYAAALLTAPFLMTATLLALSLLSLEFFPAFISANDKLSPVLLGIAVGLVGGFVEELGWTGFAVPKLRLRHGVLATGLIVGILWAVWHLLQVIWTASAASGPVPPALFVSVGFFSTYLLPYRVLMVWVYDRTGSLLIAVLMLREPHRELDLRLRPRPTRHRWRPLLDHVPRLHGRGMGHRWRNRHSQSAQALGWGIVHSDRSVIRVLRMRRLSLRMIVVFVVLALFAGADPLNAASLGDGTVHALAADSHPALVLVSPNEPASQASSVIDPSDLKSLADPTPFSRPKWRAPERPARPWSSFRTVT